MIRRNSEGKQPVLLVVDDLESDMELAQEALREWENPPQVLWARDGEEALELLRGACRSSREPQLVLLDLNMPRMGGLEFLRERQSCPELRVIPVVVLTTSSSEEDVQAAYRLGANGYLCKPLSFERFLQQLAALEAFWFGAARLPGED